MGAIFSPPKTPKVQQPVPPPAPPTAEDPAVQQARDANRAVAAGDYAGSNTDVTNGGLTDTPANLLKKKLLGL